MKTVAVIEGFAGGPMHTRKFRKALVHAGLKVIKNKKEADIIIAHSAGIYSIPSDAKAELLMLIGPTYWPKKRLISRVWRHNRSSGKYHIKKFGRLSYLRKKLLELYYFFRRHVYLWHGVLNNNKLDSLNMLIEKTGRKVIIIRNYEDPFTSPELKSKIKIKDVRFVELPGVHDDYVTNPEPYIDLLLKEL